MPIFKKRQYQHPEEEEIEEEFHSINSIGIHNSHPILYNNQLLTSNNNYNNNNSHSRLLSSSSSSEPPLMRVPQQQQQQQTINENQKSNTHLVDLTIYPTFNTLNNTNNNNNNNNNTIQPYEMNQYKTHIQLENEFKQMPQIQLIEHNIPNQIHVQLYGNIGCHLFSNSFISNQIITKLTIRGTGHRKLFQSKYNGNSTIFDVKQLIDEEGWRFSLSKVIAQSEQLEELGLTGHHITKSIAQIIVQSLTTTSSGSRRRRRVLQVLDLWDNRIDGETAVYIVTELVNFYFYLNENDDDGSSRQSTSSSLRLINLGENELDGSSKLQLKKLAQQIEGLKIDYW